MAKQYSPTQFFRRVPNALLARYFQEKHGVLLEIEFDKLKENEVEPVFQTVMMLPEDKIAALEAECQDIDAMACQGGITALTDEADFHQDTVFPEAISNIDGFHGKSMWSFLEHYDYWLGATLFLHSDNIAESHWKKRNNLPHLQPHVEPEDTDSLAQAISEFFHNKEGRGRNCKVEVFRRYNREYFFAYPEDYAQSGVEWVRNSLSTRARHPAFEIIFVYCQTEGSLDIYAPRNTKYIPDLQLMFAEAILKLDELDEFSAENRVYALDALADADFVFQYPDDCGIESVAVRSLRLTLMTGKKRRVTIEADPSQNPKAVYEVMESLTLPAFHVTQAEIKVNFAPNRSISGGRTRTFKISYPNWCALRHDGRDLIIRQMLAGSGIEPIPAAQTTDNSA